MNIKKLNSLTKNNMNKKKSRFAPLDSKHLTGRVIRLPRLPRETEGFLRGGSVATLQNKNLFFNLSLSVIIIAVFAVVVVGVLGFEGGVRASMLTDFETGENTNGSIGGGTGYFRHQSGKENYLPVVSPGAQGTNYCVEYITESWELAENGDHPQSFYIDHPSLRTLIEEADGANRMKAWIKLPEGYELGNSYNLHIGTYTRDPEVSSNSLGAHYYHYFNVPASDYWSLIIANEHPQAQSGSNNEIGNNPTLVQGWNYYEGFTRFYFHNKGGSWPAVGTWSYLIDEVEFYHEDEPENTQDITSLSCSYFGEGHFQLNWHGDLRVEPNPHFYEVRYSNFLITNANYTSATIAPGCTSVTEVDGSYNWMSADFTIPITDGTAYFAIKDLSSDNPYVTRIDYPISLEQNDLTPPSRSNSQPTGTLSSGTTQTTISLTTNETAVCKYGTLMNVPYDSITNTFSSTNSTTHSQTISNLSDGNTYHYYVRCQDESGNQNPDDFEISFSVASPPHTAYGLSNFIQLVADWLKSEPPTLESDVNGDGVVNTRDLGIMMSNWQ